jgi:hypothetical protein
MSCAAQNAFVIVMIYDENGQQSLHSKNADGGAHRLHYQADRDGGADAKLLDEEISTSHGHQ